MERCKYSGLPNKARSGIAVAAAMGRACQLPASPGLALALVSALHFF